ncbi:SDR family NAD(P)-dependent oxidoreductase [Lachnoclostridium sp. An181]|uniref:SDR family NAD(P)-dependent oxidoreductase n=1 Tax=Lachnoclostridium sp. An181 TaxID=1965575 RepID=UPI001FA9024B|nr:SDR family NAD(P)-dependent oxidoreductase [Lachnoclostridium sp. An181]
MSTRKKHGRGERMNIALITGASSGIGREFAKQIAKKWRHIDEIWVVARRRERLETLKKQCGLTIKIVCADLLLEEGYLLLKRELKENRPAVRIVVNAAGVGKDGTIADMDWEVQEEMIQLNCLALSRVTKICLPYLSVGSRVIQVASAAAFGPQPGFAVYAATKAYVLSYSRALAEEVRGRGIIVTSVCPGPVDTEFFGKDGKPVSKLKQKSMAKPEDVVRKALLDSAKKKRLSVYKPSMKAVHAAWKVMPTTWMLLLMKKFL